MVIGLLYLKVMKMKMIRVTDCQDCPFYERFTGRENVYHTCHHSCKTVQKDFTILFRFCELEEMEELDD